MLFLLQSFVLAKQAGSRWEKIAVLPPVLCWLERKVADGEKSAVLPPVLCWLNRQVADREKSAVLAPEFCAG